MTIPKWSSNYSKRLGCIHFLNINKGQQNKQTKSIKLEKWVNPPESVINSSRHVSCQTEHVWDVLHPLAGLVQYTRATFNAVSWIKMMAKWPWRSRSMTAIYNINWENPRCIFGINLVILAQIHYKLTYRQLKFPRILSQNRQNGLEDQSQWPPLSIVSQDACFMQIWWF